ncbi:TRAP transporter permease [Sneathiella litorea]|uniref:TRAP transporter fused permease subunit n=1 Tax=Sneathiella litorea TaxID=2606216 RepID=A0A6L8WDS9_9PROT|nr:TRAP transporter fused permease subunit [Sneathiella litorea]MZR32307.1 TRAP transporter fused permease subunit [Sneathiella litorea]
MSSGEILKTEGEDSGFDTMPRLYQPLMWVLCMALVFFQIYTAGFGQFPPLSQRAVHVGLGLAIVFLGFVRFYSHADGHQKLARISDVVFAALAIAATVYILTQEIRITESFNLAVQPLDMALGTILTIILLVAAWRTTGPALPVLAIVMLLYTLFGQYIPGTWGHPGFDFQYVIEHLYLGTEGIWGTVTGLSANLIAIFIIFGAFLMATGAAQTFMDMALIAAGRFPGGAAKVATVSSALFGMLNGAAVANVASTGAFTIPAMKRLGYKSSFAGAVEATASSGGQITPPIMGAGAFVMAELLSVPYLDIVYAAIIPAFLFYACVWMSIDVEARREDMRSFDETELPTRKEVLALGRIGPLVVTLAVLLFSMFSGNTPTLAAFYAICTNVGLYLLIGIFHGKDIKQRILNLQKAVIAAAFGITGILALLVTAQVALSLIGLTGSGIKLSEMIVSIGDGQLFIGVLLSMAVALILGMGMPTTAAYLLAAAVAAPALISLDVDPLVAHFVVFYSALLSALTPPVCTAVFTAAVIAKTDWWSVSLVSIRLALMKYLMPLFFVFRPAVLLEASAIEIVWSLVMGLVASMLLAIGGGRFYRQRISLPIALFLGVIGALVAANQWWMDVIAILVLTLVVVTQRRAVWLGKKAKI